MDFLEMFGIKKILVVDVFNLAFRAWHGYQHLNQDGQLPVAHIYGTTKMLMSQMDKFGVSEVHFVTDGYPRHRYEAFPSYKGTRTKEGGSFSPIPEVIQLLRMVPGYWYSHQDAEADDIIATLVHENPTAEIRIVSSDRDLWSLVGEKVYLVGNKSEIFTAKQVEEKLGVPPEKVQIYKTFFGDNSDNIPGVPRIRKKKLIPLLMKAAKAQDVYGMLDGDVDLSKNEVAKLREFREQATINDHITRLVSDFPYEKEELQGDQAAMVSLLEERNCPSLVPQTEIIFGKAPPIKAIEDDLIGLAGLFS